LYADYFHISPGSGARGDFSDFGAPNVGIAVSYDEEFAQSLAVLARREGIAAGPLGERSKKLDHATMVPLYFFNETLKNYRLVRVSLSGLSPLAHYRFGQCVQQAAAHTDKRVVFIASGDLSHKLSPDGPYGFAKEGPQFDAEVTQAMQDGDFMRFLSFGEEFCDLAAECGLRAFLIMAGALDGMAVRPELLSYEGPFGVGYAVASFEITGSDESRRFGRLFEQREQERLEKQKSARTIMCAWPACLWSIM
jgi:aromatic ring-opening dioxygenase LigB subunit